MSTNPKDYPEFFIEFLEDKGIYDEFMYNVEHVPLICQENIEDIEIDDLIFESFSWGRTKQGQTFWRETYEEYHQHPIVKDIIRSKLL